MPVPTGRLALLLVAAAAVVALVPVPQPLGFGVVLGVVVVAAVVDAVRCPAPRRITVERSAPGPLVSGATASLGWAVTNPVDRPLTIRLADDVHPSLVAEQRRIILRLEPRGRADVAVELHPTRRGRFPMDELAVRVDGPWRLMARQSTRNVPGAVRVYPPFRSREEAELRVRKARVLEVGLRSAKGRGGGTDFDQLREYSTDDEFRRIDWAATARAGKPIVRTFRAERNQSVVCLLDAGRTMAGQVAGVSRLEHAMDAVMALTTVATGLGDRCGLLAFDRFVQAAVVPSRSRGQLTRVSEALYDLHPSLVESDYRGAFTEMLARFRRRTLLVILTDLDQSALASSLVPALPLIARSHVLVVASVSDPDVVRWATETPTDGADAHRRAAAVMTLRQRERAAAQLRSFGARVVDAPAGELAARLADVYLDVKATGGL